MVESIVHSELKNDTATILKKLGYSVETDAILTGPRGGKQKVDVIAENANGKYGIEVGTVSDTKFDQLNRNYGLDQVIHIPSKNHLQTALNNLGKSDSVLFVEPETPRVLSDVETIEEGGAVKLDGLWDDQTESVGEKSKIEKIRTWQLLRDEFGPVGTGVELYIAYSVGNGFYTTCDCKEFLEEDECKHTRYINEWAREMKLDSHIQGVADRTLTHGFCLVERVFENTDSYIDSTSNPGFKELGPIVELKVIDATKKTVDAKRADTYELLYYAINEGQEDAVKLYPWASALSTWNIREPNILGESIVRPTEQYAEWLLNIQKSFAKGVYRQGNPIPIFVAKNWGTAKLKALRNLVKKREQSGGMGALIFGGEVEAKLLGVEGQMLDRSEAFNHYVEMIASSMVVPTFFFNTASVSRAESSEKQMELFRTRVGRFGRMMKRFIEQNYFTPLVQEEFGPRSSIPKVNWNTSVFELSEDILQLRQLIGVRYLSPELREAAERRLALRLGLKLPEKLTILVPDKNTSDDDEKVNRPQIKREKTIEDEESEDLEE